MSNDSLSRHFCITNSIYSTLKRRAKRESLAFVKRSPDVSKKIRLKDVADYLDLSPATVSLVLNRSPVADSIPKRTQERVFAAAKKLDYRPNLLARSLRKQRTFSVGVLVPEISEGYAAGIMRGVEHHLSQKGYFYLLASHRSKPDLLEEYLAVLKDRSVEGFILLASRIESTPELPAVAVSSHRQLEGVTNVVIDHDLAARLALQHLKDLGHERIAVFPGAPDNADAEDRWRAIRETAPRLGLEIRPELTIEITGEDYGGGFYKGGYTGAQRLMASGAPFTALFAFNDISAIGAMRAFLDAGSKIPEDVSVVGFDDIQSAAFHNPGLTTVRQPLREMGILAAKTLLERLSNGSPGPDVVTVKPELIVRGTTGTAGRAAGG